MENLAGPAASKTGALVAADVLLLLGVIAGVVLVLGFGILLGVQSRKRRRERHQHRHRRSSGQVDRSATTEEDSSRRRRVRRRRRDHRPRNPTLAEAGGLPPMRVGDPPAPAPKPPSPPPGD